MMIVEPEFTVDPQGERTVHQIEVFHGGNSFIMEGTAARWLLSSRSQEPQFNPRESMVYLLDEPFEINIAIDAYVFNKRFLEAAEQVGFIIPFRMKTMHPIRPADARTNETLLYCIENENNIQGFLAEAANFVTKYVRTGFLLSMEEGVRRVDLLQLNGFINTGVINGETVNLLMVMRFPEKPSNISVKVQRKLEEIGWAEFTVPNNVF